MKSMSSLNYNNSNRIVSFDRCVRAKKVLHLSDYTDREKEACWYDIDEIDLNKNENDSFFLLMWLAHPAVSNVFENFSRRRLLKLCYTN